ncbi:MAG: Gfo/Idh/MocA family oxidoreductase [Myxococcota bacterium]|nr:Gfo/Idh/MocA family oxidoreductase [Myxococcota bacterium]
MPNIGLIGCGYWGPNLLRNLNSLEDVNVVAVADRSDERREFVTTTYPHIKAITEGQDVISNPDIDAVFIATPAATHADVAKAALEAGKDVFVEKPLALHTDEAIALTRLAKSKDRILMVGHSFLYNAAVNDIKQRVDSGQLGNIYYMYSQRLNLGIVRSDVDAAWNLAPHDVSIGCYLLGTKPVQVTAKGIRALQPGPNGLDDVVFMSVTFENNVVMHVHVSWLDPQKVRRMTVVGDKQMIVYDDVSQDKIRIYDKGIIKGDPVPMEQPADFARFKMITRAGDLHVPNIKVPEPLNVQCKHFVDCVVNRKTPKSDGYNGIMVTAVLEAAQRSAQEAGTPIDIEIPNE